VGASLLVLFPLSIPRTASALTFSSMIGVLCSAYLSIAVATVFFSDKDYVPSISDNLSRMEPFKLTENGIISSFPLIIYAYMYQVNIPMIYVELENKSPKQMSKVILIGSSVLVILFCFVGIFGYATFVNSPEELCTKNILDNNYYNRVTLMQVSNFTMLFSVISSFPLVILPSKDSIEELFMNGRRLSKKDNIIITFVLVSMNCCLALFIPSIGDAMTLVGSTINPLIGFILPIIFY
jgi:amino acid permease